MPDEPVHEPHENAADLNESGLEATETPPAEPRLELQSVEWKRVSPKYLVVAVVARLITAVIACGVLTMLWLLADWIWAGWALPVVAIGFIIALALEPRRVRSIGYALRTDDLVFRRGIMFQRFVAVPYGRMQLIDITRGPVARILGLADLQFVTAAASTGVAIPGLVEQDAEDLRDALVALAESRRAGL